MFATLHANAPQAAFRLRWRSVLDLALDRLAEAGVTEVFIVIDGPAGAVLAQLRGRHGGPACVFDRLPATPEPLFTVQAGAIWLDGPHPALRRMLAALGPEVDGVVLVHRTFQVQADVGFGDFFLDPLGLPRRRAEGEIAPYVQAGVTLTRPGLADIDSAIAQGRARAVVHDGLWFRLSSEADLEEAEAALAAQVTGPTT